ncbi:MAG TPA: hypothetical protein VEN78_04875 [Bradyrhizobium sp.]|nr:hypothetical protein [Bradyrhizobium sp.]
MISYARLVAVICLLLAACENVLSFDYRVASRDPKLSSAQILRVVTDALDRAEAGAWAQIDEKTGEVTFALGALGSGKPPSVRNTETRLLGALRHEFGDRVEVFCNGGPLR